jgi:hypothetical protein
LIVELREVTGRGSCIATLAADDKGSQLRIKIAMQLIRERMQVTQTAELDSLQAISLKKAIAATDEL